MLFTKSYPRRTCRYAGSFTGSFNAPLTVDGVWSTRAGVGDSGTFPLTFDQPITIVTVLATNSAAEAVVAVPVNDEANRLWAQQACPSILLMSSQ